MPFAEAAAAGRAVGDVSGMIARIARLFHYCTASAPSKRLSKKEWCAALLTTDTFSCYYRIDSSGT